MMKKSVLIVLAVAVVYGTLTSFIAISEETEHTEVLAVEKSRSIETMEVVEEVDYYQEYLKELNTTGPKEASIPVKPKPVKSVKVEKESQITQSVSTVVEIKEPVSEKEVKEVIETPKIENLGTVDHSPFGALLKKHVDSRGNVNYQGFKNDEAKLDAYLDQLRNNPTIKTMGKNERLAYWINVYNAFTIKLILENYPVKSIKDINGGKPWDKQFITLGSTTYSLNMVENEVIRKRFTEPRIHFAVNCAAASCPPLLNDAFYADKLTNQLAERTKSFLSDTKYNTISSSKIEISKIFDWYGVDFGDAKSYINSKVDKDIKGASVTFKEYDWSLNKQ